MSKARITCSRLILLIWVDIQGYKLVTFSIPEDWRISSHQQSDQKLTTDQEFQVMCMYSQIALQLHTLCLRLTAISFQKDLLLMVKWIASGACNISVHPSHWTTQVFGLWTRIRYRTWYNQPSLKQGVWRKRSKLFCTMFLALSTD